MNLVSDWFRRQMSDRQLISLVLVLMAALLGIIFFGHMVAPAIGAAVIAFLLDGAVSWIKRRGVSNLLAVSIVFIGFITLSIIAFFTILPPIVGQFGQFFRSLPEMWSEIQALVMTLPQAVPGMFDEAQVATLMDQLRGELVTVSADALRFSWGSIVSLIAFVVYVVLVPVMVFFFLKDKDAILGWVGGFLPAERSLVMGVWAEVIMRWGDYARGKVYEIFIVGFSSWALYLALDLRFAAFLAMLTGISVLIPYIGAAAVTIPVAFVAFIQWGAGQQFYLAVFLYLVLQALDGNFLVPLLFSEVVKLHPNAIILAVLVFGGIWGLWGVFFAIPLATLAHAVIKAWLSHTRKALPPAVDAA